MLKKIILLVLLVSALALTGTAVYATDHETYPFEIISAAYTSHDDARVDFNTPLYPILNGVFEGAINETIETTITFNDSDLNTLLTKRYYPFPTPQHYFHLQINYYGNQMMDYYVFQLDNTYFAGTTVNAHQALTTIPYYLVIDDIIGTYSLNQPSDAPIIDDGDYVDISSFNHLPYTLDRVDVDVSIQRINQDYVLIFDFLDVKYRLITSEMPHSNHEGWADENRLPTHIKYYTDNGERFLFYEFQNAPSDEPVFVETDIINGFRPFVLWNIDTGELSGTKELLIMGVTTIVNDLAYADLLFPFILDDLLQITVQYQTVSQQFWFHETTRTHEVRRINGETVAYGDIWDFYWRTWIGDWGASQNYIQQFVFGSGNQQEHIRNVDDVYQSQNAKMRFTVKINSQREANGYQPLALDDFFDGTKSMYRVTLNRHRDAFQTKISVNDVNIVSVLYVYQGEYFHVQQDDIISLITDASSGMDLDDLIAALNAFMAWLDNMDWGNIFVIITAIIVGLIVVVLLGPIFSLIKLIWSGIKTIFKLIFTLPRRIFKLMRTLFIPKPKKKGKRK